MKESLINVLRPMLDNTDDRKLLEVPIEFSSLPHIDAAHVFDNETGKRWIVLNSNVFSAVRQATDRFCDLISLNNNPTETKEELLSAFYTFPNRIAGYFSGAKGGPALEYPFDASVRGSVWVTASAQQVFLILHEFGHLSFDHGRARATDIGSHVSVWRANDCSSKEENEADLFAATHMARGPWPKAYSIDRRPLTMGTFQLFECFELLRKMRKYSIASDALPRERFVKIATAIDHEGYLEEKPFFDDYQSMFDAMYALWKPRYRAPFLLRSVTC